MICAGPPYGCVQVQTAQAAQISSGKKCAFYERPDQEKLLLFFAKNDIIIIIKRMFLLKICTASL